MVVVTVTYVGPETLANVSALPSGSVAESGLLTICPSLTVTFAGCASVGAWLAACACPAPSASYQSGGRPLTAPHGSAISPKMYVFPITPPSQFVLNEVPTLVGSRGVFGNRITSTRGDPVTGVTEILPSEWKPAGEDVPGGLEKVHSTSVASCTCACSDVNAAVSGANVPHVTVPLLA